VLGIDVPSVGETIGFVWSVFLDVVVLVVAGLGFFFAGRWLMRNIGLRVVTVSRETVVATRSTVLPGILAAVGIYLWPQAQDAFGSVPKPLQFLISGAFGTLTAAGGLLATRGREQNKVLSTIVGGALLAIPIAGLIVGLIVDDWWSKYLALDGASRFYIAAGVLLYGVGIGTAALMAWEKGQEAQVTKEVTTTKEYRLYHP
jgi:hypothetical protein